MASLFQMLGILAAIAAVFFLAWFVTRAVAINGTFSGRGRYFTVLEKFPVAKDSYIMIVKSFDKLLFLGVTSGQITLLKEIDADSVDIEDVASVKQSFSSIFKTTLDATLPDGRIKDKLNQIAKKKKGGSEDE